MKLCFRYVYTVHKHCVLDHDVRYFFSHCGPQLKKKKSLKATNTITENNVLINFLVLTKFLCSSCILLRIFNIIRSIAWKGLTSVRCRILGSILITTQKKQINLSKTAGFFFFSIYVMGTHAVIGQAYLYKIPNSQHIND